MKTYHYKTTFFPALLVLLFMMSYAVQGQVKMEKEERIRNQEFPKNAKSFHEQASISGKIKWCKDTDVEEILIEAKTKHAGSLYSIEFDTTGHIMNVEYLIKFEELSQNIKKAFESQLNAKFNQYNIQKTQKQYTESKEALMKHIQKDTSQLHYSTRFEIVLEGIKENYKRQYELLTNQSGDFVSIVRIVKPNMDILIY